MKSVLIIIALGGLVPLQRVSLAVYDAIEPIVVRLQAWRLDRTVAAQERRRGGVTTAAKRTLR